MPLFFDEVRTWVDKLADKSGFQKRIDPLENDYGAVYCEIKRNARDFMRLKKMKSL